MKSASPILFASLHAAVWIRIDGKGSFEISGKLREFVAHEIQLGKTRFVIDLDRCPGMDSTFMGTLLGISKDVSNSSGGLLDVVNANARNVQLLNNLGLTSMLSLDERCERWQAERRQVECLLAPCDNGTPQDKRATAQVMLEAHEELANAQPENAVRFEDVIHYLKADLQASADRAH